MESVNGSSPLPPTTSPYSDIYYYIEVILLALFFLLGVIGNSIVIDVYKPTRVQCVHVWFVFVLAIVDLISSGFCKLLEKHRYLPSSLLISLVTYMRLLYSLLKRFMA